MYHTSFVQIQYLGICGYLFIVDSTDHFYNVPLKMFIFPLCFPIAIAAWCRLNLEFEENYAIAQVSLFGSCLLQISHHDVITCQSVSETGLCFIAKGMGPAADCQQHIWPFDRPFRQN